MTLTCVVRDFSDLGARIQIVGAVTPPDQFTLKIDIYAIWVVFEVIWRDGNWLGERFKNGVQKKPTTRGQVFQSERKCSILRRSK